MLASPIIEGTLPAFYLDNGTATIAVPFSKSKAVSDFEVSGYSLKIKNIQSSEYLLTLSHSKYDASNSTVYFEVPMATVNNTFTIGSFYKAQLAYIDNNQETGYYSTVGIIKYTTKPEVTILGLSSMKSNGHQYSYTGVYSQKEKDFTEKAYSFKFIVKNKEGKVIKDTGYTIHNYSKDTSQYESQDDFLFSQDLAQNESFTITYVVKTNNGLEIASPPYKLVPKTSMVSTLISSIKASLDYNNGYIKITMLGELDEKTGTEKVVKGSFVLSRTSEKSNYLDWEIIDYFNLTSVKPSSKIWRDFTIEQGINYKYSVQQYNQQNLFSQRLMTEKILADFEDAFLYDGERQLRIRFNPKISSFKKNLLEQKIDTIGSKYPFIFKNGNVEYREFPISGLISRIMDEQNLFIKNFNPIRQDLHRQRPDTFSLIDNFSFSNNVSDAEKEKTYKDNYLTYYIEYFNKNTNKLEKIKWVEYIMNEKNCSFKQSGEWYYVADDFLNNIFNIYVLKYSTIIAPQNEEIFNLDTNLTSQNIQKEREFKMEVLDWLSNGKPKLFKSPTEGNYLVRLMNVSLSPEDQLGRMLHNFSCTAYEIDDLSYDVMVKYNIINTNNENDKYLKIMSVPLQTFDRNWAMLSQLTFYPDPISYDEGPYYAQGNLLKLNRVVEWATIEDVTPGTRFIIDGQPITVGATGKYNIPISVSEIQLEEGQYSCGILTYAYYGAINDSFNQIENIIEEDVIGRQIIGFHYNVLDRINNVLTQVSNFKNIKFLKRPIQDLTSIPMEVYQRVEIDDDFYDNYENNCHKYYIQDPENDEKYIPAPEKYVSKLKYYEKFTEYDLYDSEDFLIAHLDLNDKIGVNTVLYEEESDFYYNPLVIYHFKKDYSNILKDYLYKKVLFIQTEHGDTGGNHPRDIKNRTSENPYLMHVNDFYLYGKKGMIYTKNNGVFEVLEVDGTTPIFPDKDYYLKEDIDFYFDPLDTEYLYLSNDSYQTFKDNGKTNFSTLKEFKYTVYINGNQINIDLTNKEEYNTGVLNSVTSVSMPMGVYCELFYKGLNIDYDVRSDFNLQILKEKLESEKYKLSKEYLINKVINSTAIDAQENYIIELERIYASYNTLLENYLQEIDYYLKMKEEE